MFLLARLMGHDHARATEIYSHILPDHLAAARGVVSFMPKIGPARLEASRRWGTG